MTTTEHPATERSESRSVEVQGNLSNEPAETENPHKNDDDEELQSDQLQDVPDGLQDFRHGLVDESVPEHRDASSFLMNYLWSREQRWYRVSTAFSLTSCKHNTSNDPFSRCKSVQ